MPDSITKKATNFIDFKSIFSVLLYVSFFLVYYFVGLKNNKDERKNYNDLPVFLAIILYVYNVYIFYSSYKGDNKFDAVAARSNFKIWLQIGLFYILNLILMYTYFNPTEEGKTLKANPSGNTLEYIYQDNKLGVFAGFAISGLIALVLFAFTFLPEFKGTLPKNLSIKVVKVILVLFIFFGLLFATIYMFLYTPWPLTLVTNIINIGVLVGLLAILYSFIPSSDKTDKHIPSWFNLIKLSIFFIPCLFIDLIEYLKKQVGLTTSTTWIILLIEIILIVLRIILPMIYKQIKKTTSTATSIFIEKGPVYTNKETDLGIFQNHKKDGIHVTLDELDLNKKAIFNYNYAVSCWIWINPQPPSTNDSYNKSTTLLNLGNVLKINFNKNTLEIFAATTKDSVLVKEIDLIYELKNIPYQKWNNIILNYSGGTLDIFINNILVSSSINITPVMYYDRVTAGAINGIYGGIKDIVYYDNILSKKEIEAIND